MKLVKKVVMILATCVVCMILAALVLNIVLPEATTQVFSAAETTLYKSTGFDWDVNRDGYSGKNPPSNSGKTDDSSQTGAGVEGFK